MLRGDIELLLDDILVMLDLCKGGHYGVIGLQACHRVVRCSRDGALAMGEWAAWRGEIGKGERKIR